ncbi:MAG: hypothetical protein PSX81_08620 [bacterium]|nr:hypothetical protein [bacterium]
MKSSCFVFILLICSLFKTEAQKIKGSWYWSVTPTIGNGFTTFQNPVSTQIKDSLKKQDRWRSAIGASALFGIELSKTRKLMIGLQFSNYGFTRKREDYKFLDTLHPEIGVMYDLSQTGGNYINFNYRYQYLTIPVLYSTQISGKAMKSSTIYWNIGGSISGLVHHDIRAVLNGFSAQGQKVFKLKNNGENPGLFNANFHTGFRLENLIDGKRTYIFVQPSLNIPLLNANYGKERHHLYALSFEVGFIFKPEKISSKE